MKRSILIFDNNDKIRQFYKKEFEEEGYHVFSTNNGKEAIRLVKLNSIELVVMEIVFPNGSGVEYLNALRNLDPLLKIIINSNYSAYQFNFRLWAAEAFVTKSSDLLELKRAIEHLLKKRAPMFENEKTLMEAAV